VLACGGFSSTKIFFRGKVILDLYRTIQELQEERKRVLDLIRAMEEVQRTYSLSLPTAKTTARRRGRKSMGEAERQQVSARMKQYWAIRRATPQYPHLAATG